LIVLGRPIIALIYQRGDFTPFDTDHTAGALAFYAIGLAGYSAIKILAPAFYALGDARTPMVISLLMIAVNFFMNWALVGVLEERGLALSTSTVALVNFALLYSIMSRRVGGIEGRATAAAVGKIILASAVMGAACWAVSYSISRVTGDSQIARAINVFASVAVGAVVFYFSALSLGVRELRTGVKAIINKFTRRLRR
jgi:putative peptidoglycan lipid II flippase